MKIISDVSFLAKLRELIQGLNTTKYLIKMILHITTYSTGVVNISVFRGGWASQYRLSNILNPLWAGNKLTIRDINYMDL